MPLQDRPGGAEVPWKCRLEGEGVSPAREMPWGVSCNSARTAG